jgi:hypothetical protein
MNEKPSTEDIRYRVFTRRDYLIYSAVMEGTHAIKAADSVSSWATDNPDVDMDETMTWGEWEAKAEGA